MISPVCQALAQRVALTEQYRRVDFGRDRPECMHQAQPTRGRDSHQHQVEFHPGQDFLPQGVQQRRLGRLG